MSKNKLLVLIILYFGFISLGLPDQALGIAWPDMRRFFNQPLDAAGIIIFMTAVLGAVSGFFSGWFIRRFSILFILIISTVLTVMGLAGYAFSLSWTLLILATIPQGLGAGAIDAALNDYVAKNYTSRHMNWLHACWGVGASMGPAIMTFAVSHGSWRFGYVVLAIIQTTLIALFIASRRLWKSTPDASAPVKVTEAKAIDKLLSPAPVLSMCFFALYTASEFSVGLWFYSVMVELYHIKAATAGVLIVFYWGSLMAGRFLVGLISNYLGNRKVILLGLVTALSGTMFLFAENYFLILIGLVTIGLGFAGLYPSMMHETPRRFNTKLASALTGFQVAFGSLGVAVLAPLIGFILTRTSLMMFVPLLICTIISMIVISILLNRRT